MNDNYLWDRTGEPDAEIQKLEEVLGSLRYEPQPLSIPAELKVRRNHHFIPLAIAAAIALLVIAAGLWFRVSRSQTLAPQHDVKSESPTVPQTVKPLPPNSTEKVVSTREEEKPVPRHRRSGAYLAFNQRRS